MLGRDDLKLVIHEDNQAAILVVKKGYSPKLRHISRTHKEVLEDQCRLPTKLVPKAKVASKHDFDLARGREDQVLPGQRPSRNRHHHLDFSGLRRSSRPYQLFLT